MWDGDGAWREPRAEVILPPFERRCERLLAAASCFSLNARHDSSPQESPLAREISRLARSEGSAAATAAAARCVDATGSAAIHTAARLGDLRGIDAIVRLTTTNASGNTSSALSEDEPGTTNERETWTKSAIVNLGDYRNVAPVSLAAWRGHVDVADYLLRNGANVNARDDYGVAPLHKAIGHGGILVALRILSDGACDPNARVGEVSETVPKSYEAVSRRQTALHVACRRKAFSALSGEENATSGAVGTLTRRATEGTDEDSRTETLFRTTTPSTLADPRLVAALLRYGADPNAKDVFGETPLHHAAEACDAATARLLTRAGSNPLAVDSRGRTPEDFLDERVRGERGLGPSRCNGGLLRAILRTGGMV